MERTVERRDPPEKQKRGGKEKQTTAGQVSRVDDPDLHPLATLHLANFNRVGEELDIKWFKGDVEQKVVVHSKRAYEGEDSDASRMQKRGRLERHYQ